MRPCSKHGEDDSNPECSGSAASAAEVACGRRRPVAVRLPPGRNRTRREPADTRGDARTDPQAVQDYADRSGRRGYPARTRFAVIVVDASAITEFLLQTTLGLKV